MSEINSLIMYWVSPAETTINVVTLVMSLLAILYMRQVFSRTSGFSKHDKAWMWFLAAVFSVLLLNLSTQVFLLTGGRLTSAWDEQSFQKMLSFVLTVSRSVIALTITLGSYILSTSMKSEGNTLFSFKPVKPIREPISTSKKKFQMKTGRCYIVKKVDERTGAINNEYMDVFCDIVTHGTLGLAISRVYPNKLREDFNLSTTPVVWLSYEPEKSAVSPVDLETLNSIVRQFTTNEEETLVLLDGLEYLVLHNSFDTVLKFVQSLIDLVVQSNSQLLVSVDPKSLSEQQYHLLHSELDDFELESHKIV